MLYQPKTFTFLAAPRIVAGPGVFARAGEELGMLGVTKVLLVSDRGLQETGLLASLLAALEDGKIGVVPFAQVESDPSIETVEAGREAYTGGQCDGLLAVGGGSCLDAAKAIGLLVSHGGKLTDYLSPERIVKPLPPLVAVPTTCGTGSETTIYAVISNRATTFKMTFISPYMLPRAILLDPALLRTLPAHLVAATGFDALTHAVESYTNLQTQPFSDALNLHAIRMVSEALRPAVANHDEVALYNLAVASTMIGLAFSNTRLGLVHAMAHPLGAHAHIHHGLANAILLPYVTEFNLIGAAPRYAQIAQAMGEPARDAPVMEGAQDAVRAIRALASDVGLDVPLRRLGVTEEMLPALVEDTMKSGNVQINPRQASRQDVLRLFERALG
jgi:alcohol dehydrogenase class IV